MLFLTLFLLHGWVTLGAGQCPFCIAPYTAFFSNVGLLLVVTTFASWIKQPSIPRQILIVVFLIFLSLALGQATFDRFGDFILSFPVPRVSGCDKLSLREKLGWTADKFTVLLVGGGDGMGPLAETASAIDESGLDLNLVLVAGRNTRLKDYLDTLPWENSTYIYGFTRDMPDFMRAADAIVTKSGPGTIAEALVAGLPVILYAKLPGQEDGNVTYVEERGVGVWAPEPLKVVRTLTRWICRPAERAKVIENCRSAARPDASRVIARALGEKVGLKK
jgi:glycosyltransferase involved in cell wall biosynthesis